MTTTALEVDVGTVGADTDSASAPMQCGGGLLTLDTNSNNNSVRVNLSISLCEFSNGSGVKGEGYTGLAAMDRQGVTLNHPSTCHANSAGGVICPPKHFGCAGECDQGLFSVSRKTVQFADTFDSSMHIHVNGPRHIPAKACTPSSNRCRLAAIIPRMKFDTGSHQSRTNKNRVSKKKRLKKNKSLLTIIPTLTHPVSNLKDDFYTCVDGGDVNNPPIQPPSSEFKPNAILSIRDKDLQVINSHLSFPDKGLIFRLGNQASDIVQVPRRDDSSIFKSKMMIQLHCAMPSMKLKRK